ncbi:MAG: imidazoleglycerol-phosphate dehydratase HisB [Desulfotomaculaceae bacterium]|nr:imidazoleglycerol-phosphate dehydratase HisB [Desulfotomaculaceae bacterium]
MGGPRQGFISRKTNETDINLSINLDGTGKYQIQTGLAFFDHMLRLFIRHASYDFDLVAQGDLAVDGHHTVEDVGICLGLAIKQALGNKYGIKRYGNAIIPMDEALVMAAVDLSGRGFLAFDVPMTAQKAGDFETELVEEFLRAMAINGEFTLHIRLLAGKNTHHIIEAVFKALGRSLCDATAGGIGVGIPSTKGIL